jgi:hypothetical protein
MCPKYNCDKGVDTSCALLKAGITNDGFNKISLTNTCEKGKHCHVPFLPWRSLADVTSDTTYICTLNVQSDDMIKRYPGESCETDDQCIKSDIGTGACSNKKCAGLADREGCKSTAGCLIGFYCDAETHKCAAQKAKEGKCKESSECINELLCNASICSITPYSLDSGKDLDDSDPNFNQFKCKFNYTHKNKCATLTQEAEGDKDGFIECQYGDTCQYKVDGDDITGICDCGYNADGKGYCQRGHNKSKLFLMFRRKSTD